MKAIHSSTPDELIRRIPLRSRTTRRGVSARIALRSAFSVIVPSRAIQVYPSRGSTFEARSEGRVIMDSVTLGHLRGTRKGRVAYPREEGKEVIWKIVE